MLISKCGPAWTGIGCTHNLEGVGNYSDGHELFAVVSAIHHQGIGEAFDDRALSLAKAFDGIAASGMGDVDGGTDLDVITVRKQFRSILGSKHLTSMPSGHQEPSRTLMIVVLSQTRSSCPNVTADCFFRALTSTRYP